MTLMAEIVVIIIKYELITAKPNVYMIIYML